MPIPTSFDDLDENPNNNSPQGSEIVGPNANGYFQALGAFIKQLYDGKGKPSDAVDMNGQKISNIANGDTSSTSKDAITGAQARALAYKVGEQRFWHGAVANIATAWGPGWQLADGTNGTADLRDRFIVGAGLSYAPGATGGAVTVALTTANLAPHNHGVNDPGHAHGVNDPGHGHTSNPHSHLPGSGFHFYTDTPGGGASTNFSGGVTSINVEGGTNSVAVNVNASGSNIGIQGAATNISTQNAGSGTAHENRPPYYASCILEYTGIGA